METFSGTHYYRFGVDLVTGQSLHHTSFLLRHFLPLELIHDETLKRMIECDYYDSKSPVFQPFSVGKRYSIITGSLSEGLGVPDYHWMRPNKQLLVVSRDKDEMMYEANWFREKLPEESGVSPEGPLFDIETDSDGQGNYGRLRISDSYKMARKAMSNPIQTTYFDNEIAKEQLLQLYQQHFPKLGHAVELHGPSVTLLDTKGSLDRDLCIAIRFSDWPDPAKDWPTRKRPSGWPNDALINDVVQHGHFMVPVGQRGRFHEHLLWRYSFSISEKILARSLRLIERKVYIILKLLHTFYLKEPCVLPTYCLKTMFFWHCEKHKTLAWTEYDLASIIFCLLGELTHCLARGEIWHYFIPNVNLLSCAPKESLQTLIQTIKHLRFNLFRCVCNVTTQVRFANLPLRRNFNFIFSSYSQFSQNVVHNRLNENAFIKDIEQVLFEYADDLVGILRTQEKHLAMNPGKGIELLCRCTRSRTVRILGPVWRELMKVSLTNPESGYYIFLLLRLVLIPDDELLLAKCFMWCLLENKAFNICPTLDSLEDEISSMFYTAIDTAQKLNEIRCGEHSLSKEKTVVKLKKMKNYILKGDVPIVTFRSDNMQLHKQYVESQSAMGEPITSFDIAGLKAPANNLNHPLGGLPTSANATLEKALKLLSRHNLRHLNLPK